MSRKLKRPSSARRNIKLETFTPFASGSRLRRVQSLLTDGHDNSPDALLCIAGIDSRYNDGTSELINYLLFGFFDTRKTELEKSGFDEEVIDDVVFLIRRYEIDIYCNPINYMYLMPYVSHWRNVRFHCMTDKQYEDEDAAGDFKVTSFVSMVQGCQKIGIPFSVTGHNQPFDKMMIEKWPLIQAFALEDFGGGGFFTLKYEVEDVSSRLHSVYNNIDPVSLENILTENLSQFKRQWNTMITTINLDMSADPRCLTEEKICEPLKSYFMHGLVGKTHLEKMEQESPFVLLGTNTRKCMLDSIKAGNKTEKNHMSSTGVADSPAKFMICHGVAPRCPLSCTRTYFLTDHFSNPFQNASFCSMVLEKNHSPGKYQENHEISVKSDIFDGAVYKNLAAKRFDDRPDVLNVTLTMNTDIKISSSKKGNLWPLYVAINEIPIRLRFSKKYIIPCFLYCQEEKPNMLSYLSPMMQILEKLSNEGMEIVTCHGRKLVKIYLLTTTLDLPAKAMVANMKQFNGKYGCSVCLDEGEVGGSNALHRYWPYSEHSELRTHSQMIEHSKQSLSKKRGESVYGIKGPSALAVLKYIDLPKHFAIDWMHSVLLGVSKTLMNLWFDGTNNSKEYYIGSKISLMNERLLAIHIPDFMSRKQRCLEDYKHWKASECREWLFHFSIPVLEGLLNSTAFVHYCLLVTSMVLLNKEAISEVDINRAEEMLQDFCRQFPLIYAPSSHKESEDSETRCLVQVYSAMVDSVLEGIQVYASTLSVHKARAMAIEKLCEQCSRLNSPVLNKYLQRRSNIVFSLEAYNNIGCHCPVVDGQRSLMVKSMSLYLMDVPCVTQTTKPVGSLAFSEVFLDSVIKVQKEDGTQKLDSQVLILTENFPRYKAWHVNTGDESHLPALNDKLSNGLKETCGQLLMSGESVHVGTARNLTRSPVEVQLYIYSHALIIVKPETGATVLDSSNIQSLNYYDGDSVDVVSVLIVELKVLGKSSVPSYLMSQENQIYITFTPKTKAFKLMFSQVLRQWREDSNLPAVQRIDTIPQDYTNIYDQLQNNFQTLSAQPVVTNFVQAVATLPNLKQFLSHLSASSISDVPIPAAVVPAMKLVQQTSDTDRSIKDENAGILPGHNSSGDKIVVSIISGIHGSHQESLSDTITNLTKEKYNDRDIPWANCIGFSSDNCNVMVGKNNSVLTRIQEMSPGVFNVGCVCHLANICAQKAIKTLPLPIDDFLVDIFYHFHHRWTVLKQSKDSTEPFVPKSLQKSLSSLTSSNRRKKSQPSNDSHQRVIVITPGCMDIVEVVQAIECHPDPEVRQQIKIGAVTACVDPLNTFMERKLTMPNLLNHCAQGWVNNIVFTSSTSIQNTQLSDIQILLRSINSDVAFFLAEKGAMTRSMDIDAVLSETSFMEEEKVRARHLHCPGWTLGLWKQRLDVTSMNSILLKFNQPLEKSMLLKKLYGEYVIKDIQNLAELDLFALKSSLKGFPFYGNIYSVCGLLTFTDSPQKMKLNYITLSGSLSLQPSRDEDQSNNAITNGMSRGDNFVMITGCSLEEKKLKEWLRTCARQKPEKKKIITRKDLTKEDIKKIHKQHHLDPLPAGWFYNGTQFISFDGEKQDTHPSLEDFVKAHIEKKNKDITDYNAEVDKAISSFVDLFS